MKIKAKECRAFYDHSESWYDVKTNAYFKDDIDTNPHSDRCTKLIAEISDRFQNELIGSPSEKKYFSRWDERGYLDQSGIAIIDYAGKIESTFSQSFLRAISSFNADSLHEEIQFITGQTEYKQLLSSPFFSELLHDFDCFFDNKAKIKPKSVESVTISPPYDIKNDSTNKFRIKFSDEYGSDPTIEYFPFKAIRLDYDVRSMTTFEYSLLSIALCHQYPDYFSLTWYFYIQQIKEVVPLFQRLIEGYPYTHKPALLFSLGVNFKYISHTKKEQEPPKDLRNPF